MMDEVGGVSNMSSKAHPTRRVVALAGALAAVGVMSVATTSASASVTPPTEATCSETSSPIGLLLGPVGLEKPVSGTITIKKLGQNVALNNGRFAGTIALCIREGIGVEGTITNGEVGFPPFIAPLKLLERPNPVELATVIQQFGAGEGTITRPPGNETEEPIKLTLNVQAEATIAFSNVDIVAKRKPVHCETVEPVKLPLVKSLTLEELLNGTTITGAATLPPITCGGQSGTATGNILTHEMSGPENAFSLTFGETKPIE
jgi:hypothetical protein